MPKYHCNSAKTISMLKELFAEHDIPLSFHTDNGPQFSSALFAKFADEWNFAHHSSSPTNPWTNGQAEAVVKITQRSPHMTLVFRLPGPSPSSTCIQKHPSYCPPMLTCRYVLPTCPAHNCPTTYPAQGPTCSKQTWLTGWMCHSECSVPWL